MDYPVVSKPKLEEIKVRPNLKEYDGLAKSFSWQQLRGELDGLPGGGLNLAHEAIDRHALSQRADRVAMYWEGTGGEEETYTWKAVHLHPSGKAIEPLKEGALLQWEV